MSRSKVSRVKCPVVKYPVIKYPGVKCPVVKWLVIKCNLSHKWRNKVSRDIKVSSWYPDMLYTIENVSPSLMLNQHSLFRARSSITGKKVTEFWNINRPTLTFKHGDNKIVAVSISVYVIAGPAIVLPLSHWLHVYVNNPHIEFVWQVGSYSVL